MHHSGLLPSPPLPLAEQLKQRTNQLRCSIVRANYNTQFASNTPELADLRLAMDGQRLDEIDDDAISEAFQRTVHLTAYSAYAPFVARFHEIPCKANTIVDLLAPGLPDFLILSSSTTGGHWKTFPKYNRLSKTRLSDAVLWPISDPLRKRTKAFIWSLWYLQMDVEDEDNDHVKTLYKASVTTLRQRTGHSGLYLDPERDGERMASIISDHVAPYATGFIMKWRSFLLMHALFAICSRALESMEMAFISTFVDMMRHLDAEFDVVVDCIANGTIPYLDGIEDVRHHLEVNISPDPARAAELRSLGRPSSRPGWCNYIWPNLRSINAIASGSFASSVPLAQWYLGPNTSILSTGYGSSETWIGSRYDPLELNQFKINTEEIIEFLDIGKGDSIKDLRQPWEVEKGAQYELVLTTQDGLWRYRLGDVIEIAGFDPTDGVPIIQFVQRNNVAIRFPNLMISEIELRTAMSALAGSGLPSIVNWTATIDRRRVPDTIGLFVELGSEEFSDLACRAQDHLINELSRSNPSVPWSLEQGIFRKPTVWIVRSGTFSDFLQLKLDEGSDNVGQIKVPVVLPRDEYVAWFLDHVVFEP